MADRRLIRRPKTTPWADFAHRARVGLAIGLVLVVAHIAGVI